MKPGRQSVILEILSERTIETQQDLMEALADRGVKTTQATLSRDIRDLGLIKTTGPDGKSRYVKSAQHEIKQDSSRLSTIVRESVLSFDTAKNLFIIKTIPGLANAVGSAIDGMVHEGLVGTLAGDDTCFVAFKTDAYAEAFLKQMEGMV